MSKHSTSYLIECPFHQWYDGCKLCCEGVQKNSTIHLAFASPTERRQYMKKVCYTEYENCIVAQALYNKYNNINNKG